MTTFSGNELVAKKKHSLLPLLTVVFLISYGLMTLLIVEQNTTIQAQRALIQDLFRDSVELSGMKGKAVHEKNLADTQRSTQDQAKTQSPSSQAQTPSTQAQTPSTQTPSTQAAPLQHAQSQAGKTQKPEVQRPTRPAADLADERRALVAI